MNIDTLQIKRITTDDGWSNYANTLVPKTGEYVLIDTSTQKALVVGDGKRTLAKLCSDGDLKLAFMAEVEARIKEDLPSEDPGKIFNGDIDTPAPNCLGTDNSGFAYANHSHKITKAEVESILKTNTTDSEGFNCRRIKIGDAEPSPNEGAEGDIYIKVVG